MPKLLRGNTDVFLASPCVRSIFTYVIDIPAGDHHRVRPHQSAGASNPDDALYEVSAVVGRTVYVVLTPSPSPSGAIRYAVGREVLVHVGDNTITWNDIMGQSHEVPIISRSPGCR